MICGNYIFPKTKGNKIKPWTHSTPLKEHQKDPEKIAEKKFTKAKKVVNYGTT